VAVAALLVVALVWQTGRWQDRLAASKRLRVVEAVTDRAEAAGGQVPSRVIGGSVRLLREAERLDPSDVAIRAALAGQFQLAGTPIRAEDALRKALALEPRPELYLNLGRVLLTNGDREAALDAFEDAVRLAPNLLDEVPATLGPEVRRATTPPATSARS
jgi:Flp pilus assembly protein TadD